MSATLVQCTQASPYTRPDDGPEDRAEWDRISDERDRAHKQGRRPKYRCSECGAMVGLTAHGRFWPHWRGRDRV